MRSDRLLIVGALLLAGCRGIGMDLPAPFLRLDTERTQLKATTPDDARLWVREFDDRDKGGLAFWAATLQNDLTGNRGYELVAADDVRDRAGRDGRVLHLKATANGQSFQYLVAVFVTEGTFRNTIRVAEFVARDEVFAVHAAAVRTALTTLR